MARPREFDIDTVIDDAMQVFWSLGYEGASLPDLLEGTGLTRGSLYKAFTDKRSLFIRVLEQYEAQVVRPGVAMLTNSAGGDGRDRIAAMFESVGQAIIAGDIRGCLLCSAAAGPSARDPEIGPVVGRGLGLLRQGLFTALGGSARHRDWPEPKRAELSNALLAQYVGLRVLSRSQVAGGVLESAGPAVREMLR